MKGNKKNYAIMLVANKKYLFALAEMLVNLQKTNGDLYDNIVVYHDDFSREDMEQLLRIEPKCSFIQYTYEQWEQEHKKPSTSKAIHFVKRFSHLAYAKYKIFGLLERYHKVLFLDLDMLVLGDISELFEIKGVAWRSAAVSTFSKKMSEDIDMKEYQQWFSDVPVKHPYPNGGLIYVSDEGIEWKQCLEDGHTFLMEFMDYIDISIDELTLSWIAHKNRITLTVLDRRKYNTLMNWYSYDTKVAHFKGSHKIWKKEILQTVFPEWMENYKEALEKTSFGSDEVVEFKEPCVKKKLFEEMWLTLLSKPNFYIPKELCLQYDFSKDILTMKYKESLVYEIVGNFDAHNYYAGLRIKDKKLLADPYFRERIKSIAAQCKESEQELYLYTDKRNVNNIGKEFEEFYKRMMDCIIPYEELFVEVMDSSANAMESLTDVMEIQEDAVGSSFGGFNKEIREWNVREYFKFITSQLRRYTILISGRDECSKYFNEFVKETSLPLLEGGKYRESYIAVITDGNVVVEKSSKNRIRFFFQMNFNNPLWVTMVSEGWRFRKEKSSILINNVEYSVNGRGLNIVIIDNLKECVVDFFNIDTFADKNLTICRPKRMEKPINHMSTVFFDKSLTRELMITPVKSSVLEKEYQEIKENYDRIKENAGRGYLYRQVFGTLKAGIDELDKEIFTSIGAGKPQMPNNRMFLTYDVCFSNSGWINGNGEYMLTGETGSGKRIEAVRVDCFGKNAEFEVGVYVDKVGWKKGRSGEVVGTVGENKPVIGLYLKLNSETEELYDICYRVGNEENRTKWCKNGEVTDTFLWEKIETLEIYLKPKTDSWEDNWNLFIKKIKEDRERQQLNDEKVRSLGIEIEEFKKEREKYAQTSKELEKVKVECNRVRDELGEAKEEHGRIKSELDKKNEECTKVKKELGKAKEENLGIKDELDRVKEKYKQEMETLNNHIYQLEHSFSWRITKPLRDIRWKWTNGGEN